MNHRLLPLLFLVATASCYRYTPEPGPEPEVGAVYRAQLTSSGAARLQPLLGRDVATFDGRVLSTSDSAWLFAIGATITRADPRPLLWSGEQMNIPRGAVSQFLRRELDRRKTLRAVALGTVGGLVAGSIWLSVRGKATASGPGGGGPILP